MLLQINHYKYVKCINFEQSCLNMERLKKMELIIITKESLSVVMLFSKVLTLNSSLKAASHHFYYLQSMYFWSFQILFLLIIFSSSLNISSSTIARNYSFVFISLPQEIMESTTLPLIFVFSEYFQC